MNTNKKIYCIIHEAITYIITLKIIVLSFFIFARLFADEQVVISFIESILNKNTTFLKIISVLYSTNKIYLSITISIYLISSILILILIKRYKYKLSDTFKYSARHLKAVLTKTIGVLKNNKKLTSIIIILVVIKVVLVFIQPFNTDEAWMINTYLDKTTFKAFFRYELPSNHILQTFFSRLSAFIFGYSLTSARLPSLIASSISFYFLYKLCRKFFNYYTSVILIVIFSIMHGSLITDSTARGYSISNLLFIMSLLFALKTSSKNHRTQTTIIYFIVSFLGLLTTPTYIICYFVSFYMMIKQSKYRYANKIKIFILTIVLSGSYYLLLIQLGGFNLSIAPFGDPNYFSLFDKALSIFKWLFGYPISLFIIPAITLYVLIQRKKRIYNDFYFDLIDISWIVFIISINILPFQGRMVSFIMVTTTLMLGSFINQMKIKKLLPVSLLIFILGISTYFLTHNKINKIKNEWIAFKKAKKLHNQEIKKRDINNSYEKMVIDYYNNKKSR